MSYDVTVGTKEFNYTANMREFFVDFGVYPVGDLHGKTPKQVAGLIGNALHTISYEDYTDLCAEYDSDNGWGHVDTAIKFLFNIYMACLTEPDVDTVEVDW